MWFLYSPRREPCLAHQQAGLLAPPLGQIRSSQPRPPGVSVGLAVAPGSHNASGSVVRAPGGDRAAAAPEGLRAPARLPGAGPRRGGAGRGVAGAGPGRGGAAVAGAGPLLPAVAGLAPRCAQPRSPRPRRCSKVGGLLGPPLLGAGVEVLSQFCGLELLRFRDEAARFARRE